MAGTDGGISDNAIIAETRPRGLNESGFASLGNLLGGGDIAQGQQAYANGMRMGAQTIDALAQAKQRITSNQQAEQAAQVMGSPEFAQATGVPPPLVTYAQTAARAGVPPQEITAALTAYQQMKMRSQVADKTADPNTRLSAALGLDPAGAIPKAEGLAGNFSSPLMYDASKPAGPNNTPVYVSPQQNAENQASINEKNAQAGAAQANTALTQTKIPLVQAQTANAANGGANKIPVGYQIKLDPDTMEPVTDATGRPVLERRPGLPDTAVGSRENMYSARVIQGAEQASTDVHNFMQLPVGTTTGMLGVGSGPGKSIVHTLVDNARNKLSDDYVQKYNATLAGLSRGMATMETQGLVPNGTFTQSMDSYAARDGDTPSTIAYKQAMVRQVFENAERTAQANPHVAQSFKDEFHRIVGQVQNDIPQMPEDALRWEASPKGTTLQNVIDQRKAVEARTAGQPPVANPNGAAASSGPPPGFKLVQ